MMISSSAHSASLQRILEEVGLILNEKILRDDVTKHCRTLPSLEVVEPTPIQPDGIEIVESFKTDGLQRDLQDPDFANLMSTLAESTSNDSNSSSPMPSAYSSDESGDSLKHSSVSKGDFATTFCNRIDITEDMFNTADADDVDAIPDTPCQDNLMETLFQVIDCESTPNKWFQQTLDDELVRAKTISKQHLTKSRFRSYQADQWSTMYEELVLFRQKHGHCMVKRSTNPRMAQWIKRQRYQYKLKQDGNHSTLTDDRIDALNRIDFIWDSHHEIWEQRFLELQRFKAKHGHCNVPSTFRENPKLPIWVKSQRRLYQKLNGSRLPQSKMTLDRITRMNRFGFVWRLRKRNSMQK